MFICHSSLAAFMCSLRKDLMWDQRFPTTSWSATADNKFRSAASGLKPASCSTCSPLFSSETSAPKWVKESDVSTKEICWNQSEDVGAVLEWRSGPKFPGTEPGGCDWCSCGESLISLTLFFCSNVLSSWQPFCRKVTTSQMPSGSRHGSFERISDCLFVPVWFTNRL